MSWGMKLCALALGGVASALATGCDDVERDAHAGPEADAAADSDRDTRPVDAAADQADVNTNPYCPGVVCDTRPMPLYPDADGDGIGAGESTCNGCNGATAAPEGYSYYGDDCDDDDPNVEVLVYPDGDGDGRGVADEAQGLCADRPIPDGYSVFSTDCDDDDPLVHPGATERFFDGIDSDCDGEDDPISCSPERECGCDALDRSRQTVETTAGCEGQVDVFIDWTEYCLCPQERVFTVLGNAGTEPLAPGASVQIHIERLGEADDLTIDFTELLGPGDLGVPIPLPPGRDQITLTVDVTGATDCDLTNNRAVVEIPYSGVYACP
jgi:hypothetical protein